LKWDKSAKPELSAASLIRLLLMPKILREGPAGVFEHALQIPD